MQIIAHRGFWKEPSEKNTMLAFERALGEGFGIETDLRDCANELVISHDMADVKSMRFSTLINKYIDIRSSLTLALNIKADGLTEIIAQLLIEHNISNYFCFDMSVPDGLKYSQAGLKTYMRISEYETFNEPLCGLSHGVWLDAFSTNIHNTEQLEKIPITKPICFVSPELHGRNSYRSFWNFLHAFERNTEQKRSLYLCTDFPDQAKVFFQ